MPRRRYKDDSPLAVIFDLFFELVSVLPWWVDLVGAIFSYFAFHYLTNKYTGVELQGANIAISLVSMVLQYLLPIIFVFGGVASFWRSFRGKELLWKVGEGNVAETLAKMHWHDFELMMGEWFKTQGFDVVQGGGAHADGGIDIELRKNGELFLVQCKHWRAWKVPVSTVRDLYGVMTSRGAVGGFVVTSGRFTKDSEEFAEGRVITLINGEKLAQILKQSDMAYTQPVPASVVTTPKCPRCGSDMVRRTARKGENSGRDFFGCSKFPNCRGVVSID